MSGGHFDYMQYKLNDIATMIDDLIVDNMTDGYDEWGNKLGTFYDAVTIAKFKKTSHYLKQTAEMVQRIDWLVSDDDGEDSFLERWESEVRCDYGAKQHENSMDVENLQLIECANELLIAATNYAEVKRGTT